MHNLTQGLLDLGHEVKVLCISTPKQPFDPDKVPAELLRRTRMEGIFVDTSVNIVDAFTDLLTADNYNISRFFSPDMDIKLISLLSDEDFDIVQLESLFMTPYIPTLRRYTRAKIVLRSHNLEHVIQERIATGEKNMFKRPYRRYLAKQLQEYEMAVLDRVDGVAAISPGDAEHFKSHGTKTPVVTIPFGVDLGEYDDRNEKRPSNPIFFHIGSMDWSPNEEGVRWLLENVWPRVVKKRPKVKLHLAGNKMPKDLMEFEMEGLQVKGRVKNALNYMHERQVMLVPLFSAGGMRVKIVEGMAMGKAVISTPIGAEGIDHKDGHDILLAKNATEFVDRMVTLIDDPEQVVTLGREAQRLVARKYSNGPIVQDLVSFYKRLLKK